MSTNGADRVLWVNLQLKGKQIDEFLMVKEYLGIGTNVDVFRHLLRKEALRVTIPVVASSTCRDNSQPVPSEGA